MEQTSHNLGFQFWNFDHYQSFPQNQLELKESEIMLYYHRISNIWTAGMNIIYLY